MWLHGFSSEVEEAWKETKALEEMAEPELPREHGRGDGVSLHIGESESQERDLGWGKKKQDLGVAAHECALETWQHQYLRWSRKM